MPKNLKKVQIYPNLVVTLLEVNSLTLHNLHFIVLASCKAARPAQIKFWCCNKGLRLLFLWSCSMELNSERCLEWKKGINPNLLCPMIE